MKLSGKKDFKFSDVRNQFIAVACANFMAVAHGGLMGWLSPAIFILQREDSPFGPISTNTTSWLGASAYAGAFLGSLLFVHIIKLVGRKITFFILAIPNLAFWISITVADHIAWLFVFRFFGGFVGGGMYVAVPLFVTEIAEDHVRGMLASMLMISGNLGLLVAYVTGSYMSIRTSPFVLMIFPALLIVAFLILPDTPYSLVLRKKTKKDIDKSILFYLNCPDITSETNRLRFEKAQEYLKQITEGTQNKEKVTFKDYVARDSLIAFGKGLTLVFLSIFCGQPVLQNYSSVVFRDSGSTMDPLVSMQIMIVIQVISAFISLMLIDNVGRRPLLIISSIGTSIGLVAMGTYTCLSVYDKVEGYNWVPVASLSFAVFSAYIGIIPLVFVVLVEILPPKVRGGYASFCLALVGLFMFIVVKYYLVAAEALQMYTCMFFFAIVSFLGVLFGLFVLEETKGKDIDPVVKKIDPVVEKMDPVVKNNNISVEVARPIRLYPVLEEYENNNVTA